MPNVPERWVELGAAGLYRSQGRWSSAEWHSGDLEHLSAAIALAPVLADLRRQVEAMKGNAPSGYWDDALDEVIILLDTGGSDG